MPAALAYVAEGIAAYFFTAGTVGYAFVYAAVYAAELYVISRATSSLGARKPTGEGRGLEVGITDTGQGGFAIYGQVRCNGVNIVPPITGGDSGRYLEQVFGIALHEVDSYTDVYVDDTLISNANITAITGSSSTDGLVTSGIYSNALWVRRYSGTSTQAADAILRARYPSQFTSSFRGRGIAYAAMTYDWGDGKLYRGVPIMTFVVKGKKCYDPRLDTSPGANPTNVTYIAWTSNPALCWADYAMADFGGLVPSTSINWASVVAAANICDAVVNVPGPGTQKRYTFNARISLPVDPDWRDNARLFIDAMLGRMVFRDGIWFVYAGAWDSSTFTVEKNDWLSIERIKTVAPRDGGRWNTVRCWYVDANRNWQRVECFPRRNATFKAADGAEEIVLEMEQPACDNEFEAQRKAELILRQSRNQIGLSGKLPPRFRKVATGEVGALNFEELGWSSKLMRVRSMNLNADASSDVGITEEQAADWTDLDASEYNSPSTSGTPTSTPTSPSAPQGFSLISINGTLQFIWTAPAVLPQGTRYLIWYAPSSLSDPASKTLLWEGTALGKAVTLSTNENLWYQIQAVVGSYPGPYTPNTFGIGLSAGLPTLPGSVAGGSWSAVIFPESVYKSGGIGVLATPTVRCDVYGAAAPTYAWAAVTSVGVKANSPNASQTTFVTTSPYPNIGDTRPSTWKCTVNDGANSSAPTVPITFYRDDSGPGGGGGHP